MRRAPRKSPCRRADCRRNRVSHETAAVILAADRVADIAPADLRVYGSDLRRLREAIVALRVKRAEETR